MYVPVWQLEWKKVDSYSSLQVCHGFSFWNENCELVTAGEAGNILYNRDTAVYMGVCIDTYLMGIPPFGPCAGF